MFNEFASEYAKAESDYRAERVRRGVKAGRRRVHHDEIETPAFRLGKHAR